MKTKNDIYSHEELQLINDLWNRALGLKLFNSAKKTAKGTKANLTKSQALASIASEEIKAELFDQARATFNQAKEAARRIQNNYGKIQALASIASEEAKAGLLSEAKSTFDQAKEIAGGNQNVFAKKSQALASIASEEAKAGLFNQAKETVKLMQDGSTKLEVLVSISSEEVKAELFNQAKETAKGIKDGDTKSKVLASIASEEVRAGLFDQARATFNLAKETATSMHEIWIKPGVLASIASEEVKAGLLDQARITFNLAKEIARGTHDNWGESQALASIASEEAKAGLFDQAKETVEGIQDKGDLSQVFLNIASEEAKAKLFDQARATFNQAKEAVRWISRNKEKSKALESIASEEAKAGLLDQAKETARGIKDISNKSEALASIAEEEAKAELFNQAKETVRGIQDRWIKQRALASIASEEAKAKLLDQAKETARGIQEDIYKSNALASIASEEAKAGLFNQAKETAIGILDSEDKLKVLGNIASEEAKAGLSIYLEGVQGLKKIENVKENINQLITRLVNSGQGQSLPSTTEGRKLIYSLRSYPLDSDILSMIEGFGDRAKILLNKGFVDTEFASKEKSKELLKTYSKRLMDLSGKENEKTNKYWIRLILEIIRDLDSNEGTQLLLESARKLSSNSKFLPRLMKTLSEINNVKAFDMVVKLCSDESVGDRLVWYFMHKLISVGYLPISLGEYLRGKKKKSGEGDKSKWAKFSGLINFKKWLEDFIWRKKESGEGDKKSQEGSKDTRLIHAIRLIIRKLGLNPDPQVLSYILDMEWKDSSGNQIQDLEKIIDIIKIKKDEIEEIIRSSDRFTLIKRLKEDKYLSTLYYILYGGKTRFALVNSYNTDKFNTILRVIDERLGDISESVLDQWTNAMQSGSNYTKEEINKMRINLIEGRFPLEGIIAKNSKGEVLANKCLSSIEVNLDVSDSGQLDSINNEASGIFGNNQLGAVLKIHIYEKFLQSSIDDGGLGINKGLLNNLQSLIGLTGSEELIKRIEKENPDFAQRAEEELSENWKKLGEKNILDLSLHATLNEANNSVDIGALLTKLEQQRKSLQSSLTQRFNNLLKGKSTEEKAKLIQEKQSTLERFEAKEPSKLLGFIIEETLKQFPSKTGEKLLTELESHLLSIFQSFERISGPKNSGNEGSEKKTKKVILRHLDKKQDLIPSFRFADSAQCCFTSTEYKIEWNDIGHAEWIARIWKDPLSYVYIIEEPKKENSDDETINAIGFVFGFYGLDNEGLSLMLNGVYLQNKTDTGVQSILNAIEDNLGVPMQLKPQFVASQQGGTAYLGNEYENSGGKKITRLRALKQQWEEEPETEIYDDIGIDVNKETKLAKFMYRKKRK